MFPSAVVPQSGWGAVGFGVWVHTLRFGVIMGGLALAPHLQIHGWWAGLFVNVLCSVYSAALMTRFGLWRASGFLTLWRGGAAALVFLPLVLEGTFRAVPAGLLNTPPGVAWWCLTLLLVGFNEELLCRGVVQDRLNRSLTVGPATAITAVLFGLQHLSLFATTARSAQDILTNVLASGCYGFALAAFQQRFAWLWPLVIVHAVADLTTLLTPTPPSDLAEAVVSIVFLLYGWSVLRGARGSVSARP